MAKATFDKTRTLFTSKLNLNLRKRLVRCHIWSTGVYDAETWTHQKGEHVRNEGILHTVKERRNILCTTKRRKCD
jgi:hypothetical protein